jgi:hypothetical protein
MFQKTKRRLALSYAALFLLILAAFGSAIYVFVEDHLFAKLDEALTNQVQLFETNPLDSKAAILSQPRRSTKP